MLYKYRAVDKFTESIFSQRQLWFASLNSFNDPFDCRIYDKGGYSTAQVMKYLQSQGMDPVEASTYVLQQANDPGFIDGILSNARDTVFKKWGILCLSRKRDDVLMWSHYCASHTGFVIGFDVLKCPEFFCIPLNVTYSKDYPMFAYLEESEKIVAHGIAIKSKQWEYEEEVRIMKEPSGLHKFSGDCLTQVIFGCRMPDNSKNQVLAHIHDYNFKHVEIWEAACSRKSYVLELHRVS